jgi:iron(III) transport system permease protein
VTAGAAAGRAGGLAAPAGWVVGVAAYVVVAFAPCGWLLGRAVTAGRGASVALATDLTPERVGLLARSVGLSASCALLAVLVGALVATLLWQWRTGPWGAARWGVLALAAVPWYVHALAWSRVVSGLGSLAVHAGLPPLAATGGWLAVWVQTMSLLPLAAGLSIIAFESVPDELVDAGRVAQSDTGALLHVVAPLARPILLAAGAIVFVLSLLDYSVPALFQVNVYSLAVFADYSARNDPTEAFLVALPLVLVAAALALVAERGLRRAGQPTPRSGLPGSRLRHSRRFRWLQLGACLVVAAQAGVPFAGLIRSVGSVRAMAVTLAASRAELATSLSVAGLAAAVCLPLAVVAATGLARRDALGRLWWALVAVPLAIPASLQGIGLIAMWDRPMAPGIYGTLAMPVLASLVRFVPFAALAVFAQERRVDPLLVDASRVFQATPMEGWRRVRLPLLAPGLAAALCVTFVLALGELGATLIVAPPGQQTLTLRIYNYLHYGASDAVAALCLAVACIAVLAGAGAVAAITGWSRIARRAGGLP